MEALPLYLVAFIGFCLMQPVPALECYECSDFPLVFPNASTCRSGNFKKTTCGSLMNRCYTAKFTKFRVSLEIRQCTISVACNPKLQDSPCKKLKNITRIDSCEMKCCEDDLCDPFGSATVLAASCGTILLAFALYMLA